MAVVHTFLLAVCLLLGSCSTLFRASPATLDVTVELPPRLAAVRVAEAVRRSLPFADPLPYAAGAPVALGAGEEGPHVVRYECRGGTWLPVADQRAYVDERTQVRTRATDGLPGYGLGREEFLALEVAACADGARVHGVVPPRLLPGLIAAIERLDEARPQPDRLAQAERAAKAGASARARALRDHYALAGDPIQRARAFRDVDVPSSPLDARRLAVKSMRSGDLTTARTLLHTAHRADPSPIVDYQLTWRLHRQADDEKGARSAALLALEHARATPFAWSELPALTAMLRDDDWDGVNTAWLLRASRPATSSTPDRGTVPAAAPPR